MSTFPRRTYDVTEGLAVLNTHLPAWSARYDGATRRWVVQSPNFLHDGVSVEGAFPEVTIERARLLLNSWTPGTPGQQPPPSPPTE